VRRLAPARLRDRLALVMVLLVAAALLAVGVAQYILLRNYLFERTRADVISQAITSLRLSKSTGELPQVEGSSVAVYDSEGRRVGPPELITKRGVTVQPWIEPTPDQVRSMIAPFLGLPDKIAQPIVLSDVMVTAYPMSQDRFLVIETPLEPVTSLLREDVAVFAVAASTAVVAAALLAVWLTGRTLRPLERVAAVARAVSHGAYDQRTGLRGAGEMASMGAAFDEMVDRLQEQIRQERESEARMRRFLADASHELRTPVTGILGHLEVLRRGAVENRADRDESLAAMHVAAERMARLVTDLLTLARFEQAEARLRPETVDVQELLRAAARGAVMNGHGLVVEPMSPGLAVLADRDATERILVNLLDNAAKYSPAGTTVELAGRPAGEDWVELLVADHGPGIEAEEREWVFERLYRGDRSRAKGASGAGLGLAICRALARGQGGEVTARQTPGGGATFVLKLPRS
jgi:two-component system, OmpR family, sensor kinase